ncbi:MAG: hypothetical protein LBR41_02760 [Rickettsiales bacterium]|jgi:hypothetical protein|nr:hypothetical protein [Rickettsiales bacterium]
MSKTLNYKLLDTYQTHSPTFTSQNEIVAGFEPKYSAPLLQFAIGLQKMFATDRLFNKTDVNSTNTQRIRIHNFFDNCFAALFIQDNLNSIAQEHLFAITIARLIGAQKNADLNFAYGFKLYRLFKWFAPSLYYQNASLFKHRVSLNVQSAYYEKNPGKTDMTDAEIDTHIIKVVERKLSRYKTFSDTRYKR